jgi:hypothetical protein
MKLFSGDYPLGYANRGVKLTTYLSLVLRLKCVELYFFSHIHFVA